jgi:hypothetical protein
MEAKLKIRVAKEYDIDAITEIALLSMSRDPAEIYRYQYAELYPEEHKESTRNRYNEYLKDQREGRFYITVAELLDIEEVIAFAIWQLPRSLSKAMTEAEPGM